MISLSIFEDITAETHRQRDWETPGGIGPIAECMLMGQRLGMGVVCVSHTLSGLSPIIRQNIETWLVFGLPGEDPRLICNTLRTTPQQADRIKGLTRGEMVLYNPSLIEKPVYARFDKPQILEMLDEATRRATAQNFLKQVKASPPAPLSTLTGVPAETDKPGPSALASLSSAQIEMLVSIATGAPKSAAKLCEHMGLSRQQLRRITKRLESIGATSPHRFATGKVGGQFCVYEITDYGWQILQAKGIIRPKPLTNGDFEHELAAKLIQIEAKRLGFAAEFEVDIQGLRLDAALINRKTGRRSLFNIGISRPAYEVRAIEKFFTLPISNDSTFTLVARDSAVAHKVQKLLKKKDPQDRILQKIEIKLIADFIDK